MPCGVPRFSLVLQASAATSALDLRARAAVITGNVAFASTFLVKTGVERIGGALSEVVVEGPVMVFFLHDDFFKHASSRGVAPFEGFVDDVSV
jgi:hypothetical protein